MTKIAPRRPETSANWTRLVASRDEAGVERARAAPLCCYAHVVLASRKLASRKHHETLNFPFSAVSTENKGERPRRSRSRFQLHEIGSFEYLNPLNFSLRHRARTSTRCRASELLDSEYAFWNNQDMFEQNLNKFWTTQNLPEMLCNVCLRRCFREMINIMIFSSEKLQNFTFQYCPQMQWTTRTCLKHFLVFWQKLWNSA